MVRAVLAGNSPRKEKSKTPNAISKIENILDEDVTASTTLFQQCISSYLSQVFFNGAIFLNSIVLALPNFAEINESGNLSTQSSLRNAIFVHSELVFIVLFSAELILKVLAFGVIGEKSFFRSRWNRLDTFVVLAGWISFGLPKGGDFITILRLLRVIRPLRSLAASQELRKVITVVVASIPGLINVLVIAGFAFLFFSIAGLQVYLGPDMHSRCRLTPFPVDLNWTIGKPFNEHRCLPKADNIDFSSNYPLMTKSSSPWASPLSDCYWPTNPGNLAFCSLSSTGGLNVCRHDMDVFPESTWTWCGSNYDGFGNPRFSDRVLMEAPEYVPSLFWGHINFDTIFRSFLAVFVLVCLNHWSDIMYMMQDTFGRSIAVYFILLNLIGTYILLNLILTSINDTVVEYKKSQIEAALIAAEISADIRGIRLNIGAAEASDATTDPVDNTIPNPRWTTFTATINRCLDWRVGCLEPLVKHPIFKYSSLVLICATTVLLSANVYPSSVSSYDTLEGVYFLIVVIFLAEIILKMAAFGLRNRFNSPLFVIDFVVVILCFIEACRFPPPIISGSAHADRFLRRDFGMGLLAWRAPRLIQFIVDYYEFSSVKLYFGRILKALRSCLAFCLMFALFIYIFALVGMQSFANKLRFDKAGYVVPVTDREAWMNAFERPRSNFDDFFLAVGTVFQIVTAEKWYVVMNDLWRSQGSVGVTYVIVTLVLGQYVLLNQLLTLIISDINDIGKTTQPQEIDSKFSISVAESSSASRKNVDLTNFATVYMDAKQGDIFLDENPFSDVTGTKDDIEALFWARKLQHLSLSGADVTCETPDSRRPLSPNQSPNMSPNHPNANLFRDTWLGNASPGIDFTSSPTPSPGCSYQAQPSENAAVGGIEKYTDLCKAVHEAVWFNALSGSMALLSAIQLAIASPLLNPNSPFGQATLALNIIFTVYICIENVVDVVGEGPSKYFSSAWNCADTAVTLISVIGLCISNDAMIAVRVLKALRTLTAMGRLPGFSGLTNTTKAMIDVIPNATMVFMYFMGVLFFFSIFMVSSFSGQLRPCRGNVFEAVVQTHAGYSSAFMSPQLWDFMNRNSKEMFGPRSAVFAFLGLTSQAQEACGSVWPSEPCCLLEGAHKPVIGERLVATSKSYCECWGGTWEPDTENMFDNLIGGMLSLFQISTLEGWVDLRNIVTNANGRDMQPIRDIKASWIFFFIFFIIVTNFLFLNLFISEVVKSFNEHLPEPENVEMDGLTKRCETTEETWFEMFQDPDAKEVLKLEASKRLLKTWELHDTEKQWSSSENPIKSFAFALSKDRYFEQASMILILLNCATLAMPYFGASDEYMRGIDKANTAFGVLFNVELVVQLVAKGPGYMYDPYNGFDAVIVLGTDAQMISAIFTAKATSKVVSLGRMLRLLKVIRMLKVPQLQRLMTVLYSFLPNIRNIGMFLFFMVGIFAVIGMHSFGKTAFYGRYDKHANFRSIDVSLLTMFRFLSGQAWDEFMHDGGHHTVDCVVDPPYNASYCGFSDHLGCRPLNGCGSEGIYPFMLVYMLGVSICCLSLFVAVIIDGLTLYATGEAFNKIDRHIRGQFVACWRKYDKEGTGFISVRNLEKLMVDDDNPLKLFVGPAHKPVADVVMSWGYICRKKNVNAYIKQVALDIKQALQKATGRSVGWNSGSVAPPSGASVGARRKTAREV